MRSTSSSGTSKKSKADLISLLLVPSYLFWFTLAFTRVSEICVNNICAKRFHSCKSLSDLREANIGFNFANDAIISTLYFCKSFLYGLLSGIDRISEHTMCWYSSKFFAIVEVLPILATLFLWNLTLTAIPSKSPSILSMTSSCDVMPSLDNNLWHFISLIMYLLIIRE